MRLHLSAPHKLTGRVPKQGVETLAAAVSTFMDTRAIAVRVHGFGAASQQRLIGLPSGADAAAGNGAPAEGHDPQQQLPPVISNDLVTITPVQLSAAPAGSGTSSGDAAAASAEEAGGPPNPKRARTDAGPAPVGLGGNPSPLPAPTSQPLLARGTCTRAVPAQARFCSANRVLRRLKQAPWPAAGEAGAAVPASSSNGHTGVAHAEGSGADAPSQRALDSVPARRQHRPRACLEDGDVSRSFPGPPSCPGKFVSMTRITGCKRLRTHPGSRMVTT